MDQAKNDEIDLFSVFETVWDGKWKIFVFIIISSIACISYIFFSESSFKGTTKLQKSNQDLYHKYKYLNDILELDGNNIYNNLDARDNYTTTKSNQINIEQTVFDQFRSNNNQFKINNTLVFKMFINEFNDYEEMVTVLSEDDYVKDKIKNLNDQDTRIELINLAKNFVIIEPHKDTKFWQLSFVWHDVSKGSLLFNKALDQTLINVQNSLTREIENVANSLDLDNQSKKESLNIVLNSMRSLNKLMRTKRIRYLIEQSDIAKELGIEKNQLDKLTIESPDYPYYLRGFKAIYKELDLIKSRSNEENDLMSEGFFNIKRNLIIIERDIRSKQLRDAIKYIKKDNISNWVVFDLELAEIESLNKPHFYLIFSIIVSGLLGTFYVLISSSFRERKKT